MTTKSSSVLAVCFLYARLDLLGWSNMGNFLIYEAIRTVELSGYYVRVDSSTNGNDMAWYCVLYATRLHTSTLNSFGARVGEQ